MPTTALPKHAAGAARSVFTAAAAMCCTVAVAQSSALTVVDGYRVDAQTLKGYTVWRSQNCAGCHGAEQQGLVGPALIDSLKTMSKDDFVRTIREGRVDKKMPAFGQLPHVMDNIEPLYVYLKGRADGAITRAKVEALK